MISCPVCHSSETALWSVARDYEYHSTPSEYSYYQCSKCQTIFIHPVPLDELHVIYPSNYYSFVNSNKNIVTNIKEGLDKAYFKKILKRLPQNNIKVLDVGGGTGWLSSLIKSIDPRVVQTQIVDIDSNAKAIAEQNGHFYFEGRLEDFETSEKFDLILMLNLIEHVSNPLEVLKKASFFLSENGIIVIKTPNTESLDAVLFKKTYWGGLHAPRHWVIFSEKSFRLMIKETSLQISRLSFTQGGPFWAFSVIVALSRKKWIHTGKDRPVIFHPLFPIVSALGAAVDFARSIFSRTSQMFIELKHLENKTV